jgi:hypothetical protein
MKLQKLLQVLSFEHCYSAVAIEKTFDHFHCRFAHELSYWSVSATRRKTIINFWLNTAITHLALLLLVGVVACQFVSNTISLMRCTVLFLTFPIIGICLLLSFYWPIFYIEFLPKLDSYCEHFSGKQLEGMQKCKKQQYSVLGLILIQFVVHRIAGIATPSLSAKENTTLIKLYGVSNKMIEASLKTVIQNDWDKVKERKRTEIQEAFAEAHDYFEIFTSKKATSYLHELEQKVFSDKILETKVER